MIDAAFKEIVKEALREVLEEQRTKDPVIELAEVARVLKCRDRRTARKALAERGIPVETIGRKTFMNRKYLEQL